MAYDLLYLLKGIPRSMKMRGWAAVRAGILGLLGVFLLGLTGCQMGQKETIAPDAGKAPSAAEKADEEKRATSGKM